MAARMIFTMVLAAMTAGAAGAWPLWHVIEVSASHACYRATALPAGDDWHDLGTFNTFRQAGMWEWGHRDTCRVMN